MAASARSAFEPGPCVSTMQLSSECLAPFIRSVTS